ncbi:adenine-specific DNA methylase containing a Zn-ribbon-like protein [Coprobacillus sp. CAG:698]|nr:adenine-specific DNA methylase containing a Zn-ribbon-like protein [Coprobacillus sp. CAG:698]
MATVKDINHALVESTRPPLYTNMKYWGKKPHNIWYEYIKNYVPTKGVFLDPFSGSAMSAFESVRAGKKVCAFDLNPLTSFIIETYCSEFSELSFINKVKKIIEEVSSDDIYKKLYLYRGDKYVVQNVKWNLNQMYEVCCVSKNGKDRVCLENIQLDEEAVDFSEQINMDNMTFPRRAFRKSVSFTDGFLENIGKDFSSLYTKRNLYVLSLIFKKILEESNYSLQQQLLLGFIQTTHLSTKMCVPRNKKTNRDFSTSWGRSAFIYSKKQMEMNPLLLFENSCLKRQSVLQSMKYIQHYLPKKPNIADINYVKFDPAKKIDIWYGTVDAKTIDTILPEKTIDFILTDPPYGGLVQYMDLSTVWLSWLELLDAKYKPNFEQEIIVNNDKNYESFSYDLSIALKNLRNVMKDEAKIVLTFNNNDLQTWNAFLKALNNSGFKIEKVIHQQNKRTGESNVANKYGMSASDFYIRCSKTDRNTFRTLEKEEIEKILVDTLKNIILERNEPTPYQILFNGLLSKISILNIDISSFDTTLNNLLRKTNDFVESVNSKNLAGSYWWIAGQKYNEKSKSTLSNKVRKFIVDKYNDSLSHDEMLTMIFKKFPNGLTPEIDFIERLLKEVKSSNNKGGN